MEQKYTSKDTLNSQEQNGTSNEVDEEMASLMAARVLTPEEQNEVLGYLDKIKLSPGKEIIENILEYAKLALKRRNA